MYIHIYIHIYICVCVYIYIYPSYYNTQGVGICRETKVSSPQECSASALRERCFLSFPRVAKQSLSAKKKKKLSQK